MLTKKFRVIIFACSFLSYSAFAEVVHLPDGTTLTLSDTLDAAAREDIINSLSSIKSKFARTPAEREAAYTRDFLTSTEDGSAARFEKAFNDSFTFRERTFTNRLVNSRKAISNYTNQFTEINSFSRTGTAVGSSGAESTTFNTRTIDRLDRGIEHLPKHEGISYRATRDFGMGERLERGEVGVGDIVADAAYQSSSSNLNFSTSSRGTQFLGGSDESVLYELNGRSGASIPFNPKFSSVGSNQFEVTFPRNTGFRIEGHSTFTAEIAGREKTITYVRATEVEASGSAEVLEDAVASHSGAPFVRNADGRFVPGRCD